MSCRAELVTEAARLDEIGPAWDRLWRGAGQELFQSHGWVRSWWHSLDPGAGLRLHIGLCWRGGELLAVIPCATRRHRGLRVLEWAAKECSDYCDAVAGTADRTALILAWRVMAEAGGFHAVYLSHVRPGAAIRLLAGDGAGGLVAIRASERRDQAMQVRSHGLTGAAWFRTLNKKARNNHTRGKRIIAESGALSIGISDGSDEPALIERMIALKQQWLVASGQRSRVLDNEGRTLRALLRCMQAAGACQVFSLQCDGELVAGLVSIVHGGRLAAFFSAYDPRFERASPGTIVIVEQLMWAFDQGLPEVDFLCGDEPYKLKFVNAAVELTAFVGARTALGAAAVAAAEWFDRSRRARPARPVEAEAA